MQMLGFYFILLFMFNPPCCLVYAELAYLWREKPGAVSETAGTATDWVNTHANRLTGKRTHTHTHTHTQGHIACARTQTHRANY